MKRKISFGDLDVIEWAIPMIQLQINKPRWNRNSTSHR